MVRQGKRISSRPVIAVTGPDSRYPIAWWATSLAVRIAGGKPVQLTSKRFAKYDKKRFHGIIIGGGSDINPVLYGGEHDGITPIDLDRDAFEIEMIEHALQAHLPILGICRGAQLINVVLGGSLFGDIRGMRHLTSNRRTPFPRKTALIKRNTKLFNILGTVKCRINSLHHQAIDVLGKELVITAQDLDDFVQAVESKNHKFLMGVQWHPEYLFYIPKQFKIFKSLLSEAQIKQPKKLDG